MPIQIASDISVVRHPEISRGSILPLGPTWVNQDLITNTQLTKRNLLFQMNYFLNHSHFRRKQETIHEKKLPACSLYF